MVNHQLYYICIQKYFFTEMERQPEEMDRINHQLKQVWALISVIPSLDASFRVSCHPWPTLAMAAPPCTIPRHPPPRPPASPT